jgi:hypothetical protein
MVVPALGRLRQKNCVSEISVDYIVRPCLKTTITARKQPFPQKPTTKNLSILGVKNKNTLLNLIKGIYTYHHT